MSITKILRKYDKNIIFRNSIENTKEKSYNINDTQ